MAKQIVRYAVSLVGSRLGVAALVTLMCATAFAEGSARVAVDAVHPYAKSGMFAHVGTWGEADFEITNFAGFEFGSSLYCKPGESGVSCGSSPCGEGGRYIPTDVTRRSVVALEGEPLGFRSAEAGYSYASRKLESVNFRAVEEKSEKWYAEATEIFYGCLEAIKGEYGIDQVEVGTVSRDGLDELHYSVKSGKASIISGVRGCANGKLEVYLLIIHGEYSKIAKAEGDAAIANPPTATIRNWVEELRTKPRFLK